MCEDPTWRKIHWNSIWLRVQSHTISHYTWEFVTTLHDFGGVLGRPLDTFYWTLTISWSQLLGSVWSDNIWATSHIWLKAHEHYFLISLLVQKGRDRPSSLHTRRWRPKSPNKLSRMKTWHGFLHCILWSMSHSMLKYASGPPPRDRLDKFR